MIVASFFAPRFEKWAGCDYVDCPKLLQASCDKLGLRHVLISDRHFDGFDTFVQPLPANLMRAFLEGQRNFVAQLDGPALLVGADCLLTKSQRSDGSPYSEQECPIFQSLIDGKTRSGEEWFLHKDGTGFPISYTVSPNVMYVGREGGWWCSVTSPIKRSRISRFVISPSTIN